MFVLKYVDIWYSWYIDLPDAAIHQTDILDIS